MRSRKRDEVVVRSRVQFIIAWMVAYRTRFAALQMPRHKLEWLVRELIEPGSDAAAIYRRLPRPCARGGYYRFVKAVRTLNADLCHALVAHAHKSVALRRY